MNVIVAGINGIRGHRKSRKYVLNAKMFIGIPKGKDKGACKMSDIYKTIMTEEKNCIGYRCDICGKEAFGKDAEKWSDYSTQFKAEDECKNWAIWNICSVDCWYKAFKKSIDKKDFEMIDFDMPYEFAMEFWDRIKLKGRS